ncbi:MAG: Unknown protein [uncultured Sulfurovum sp.]|uniref:DUF4145 domain-containing protein n=1 Tax=uncultured Sulfurovum sp. TaxID=269237 RepID=A0A6S6S4U7_9BACT|nr:MAG: Unknown protein [uncultured Sulfurovum sp.]
MTIETIKNQKKENFKNGLIGFLEEYQSAKNNPSSFNRHSDNCGNQARKVAEAFCRYIILNSDKPDGQKLNEIEGTLGTLHEKVTRSSNVYIDESREREVLKTRLNRILDIGNEASHDNNILTTQYDLDEIKNNLLYFSEYLFGQDYIDNITSNNVNNASTSTLDNSLEDIEESKITIKLGEDTTFKDSVKKIKNSTIRIG